jgi:hypothetical protein
LTKSVLLKSNHQNLRWSRLNLPKTWNNNNTNNNNNWSTNPPCSSCTSNNNEPLGSNYTFYGFLHISFFLSLFVCLLFWKSFFVCHTFLQDDKKRIFLGCLVANVGLSMLGQSSLVGANSLSLHCLLCMHEPTLHKH